MSQAGAASVVCECGAASRGGRARCSSCGRPLTEPASALGPIDATLEQQRQRLQRLLSEADAVAAAAVAEARRRGSVAAHDRRQSARTQREQVTAAAARSFTHEREQLDALVGPLAATPAAAGWPDLMWEQTPRAGRPPQLLRIGEASVPAPAGAGAAMRLPILVPGPGRGHVVVKPGARRRDEALGLVEALVLRAIASLPSGHVRFHVHDPIGMGASLAGFAAFAAGRTTHGRPSTDAAQLRGVVERLVAHANRVSGDYLRGQHATLTDFLDVAGHGEVAYELLVLLDHPHAVDRDVAEQLARLAATAASRGVMIIVHDADGALTLPEATVVQSDGRGHWRSSLLPGAGFRLDPRPPAALVAAVAARTPPPSSPLPFATLVRDEPRWSRDSGDGLAAPLGRSGVDLVELPFDDDIPHGLVAGDTGSGKSNVLRVAIYGLARRYGPDQLQLYLLDFKEGVEFREFAPAERDPTFLPHARVVSTNSSREFGVEVLEHLARVTQARYATMPQEAKKLSSLRQRDPAADLPRIMLVVDEFHVLFERGDRLAERAAVALTLLAKQGRAAGVHFLLATQAIGDVGSGNANAARLDGIVSAARLRVALRLDERESQQTLRLGNRAAADLYERGVAIVNVRQGQEDGNRRTKVALLDDADALRERREAVAAVVGARRPARVFDGAAGADAARSSELQRALRGSVASTFTTWIGADLAVADDEPRALRSVALELTPDPHRQLAVVGGGASRAAGILQWAAVGLAASAPATRFTIVDLLREGDDVPAAVGAALAEVLRERGCEVALLAERRASAFVRTLEEAVADQPGDDAHAVVVFGADRLVGFEEPIDPAADSFMPATPRTLFEALLPRLGPARVHLLAWWATFDAFEQVTGAQHHQLGIRAYLDLPEQRVSIASGGQRDGAVAAPLALLHDVAHGSAPRAFQPFAPFGAAAPPAFLREQR